MLQLFSTKNRTRVRENSTVRQNGRAPTGGEERVGKREKKKKNKTRNSVKNVRRIFARDIPVSLVNYARVSFGDKSRRDCSNVDSFRWDWHSRVMDRGEGKSILERIFLFYVKFFSLPSFFLPFRSRIIRFVCDSWRFTICVYRSIAQRREEWKQSGKEWVN